MYTYCMTFIDTLLTRIIFQSDISTQLASRDYNVMKSLANSIAGPQFITENQSKLLLKLLRDNAKSLVEWTTEIKEAITTPQWSRPFRQIEQIKRLYISQDRDNESFISIDFTYNTYIRKLLLSSSKSIEGLEPIGKFFKADFTEHNIVKLVELLSPIEFTIEDKIIALYDTIKSWSENEIKDQYLITSITNQNFHKHITADLGIETAIDNNIINDRSMRYQYFVTEPIPNPSNIIEKIASRNKTKVWIDKNEHSLAEVLSALVYLKRLPLLIVFDNIDEIKSFSTLEVLDKALQLTYLNNNVGIYFRLPNNENGKLFNQLIAEKEYNKKLDQDTQIVAVQSGKLPKFFINNAWKPMSVLAIDSHMGLRHGKTSIYASYCDLIISYSDTSPIVERLEKWL